MWLSAEKGNAESRACQVPLRRAGIRLWAGSAVSPFAQVLGCPWGWRTKEGRWLRRGKPFLTQSEYMLPLSPLTMGEMSKCWS